MSQTLRNFLVDLASQSDRLQAFLSSPSSILDQSALNADEKDAVLSRDGRAIRMAMGLSRGSASMQMFKKMK